MITVPEFLSMLRTWENERYKYYNEHFSKFSKSTSTKMRLFFHIWIDNFSQINFSANTGVLNKYFFINNVCSGIREFDCRELLIGWVYHTTNIFPNRKFKVEMEVNNIEKFPDLYEVLPKDLKQFFDIEIDTELKLLTVHFNVYSSWGISTVLGLAKMVHASVPKSPLLKITEKLSREEALLALHFLNYDGCPFTLKGLTFLKNIPKCAPIVDKYLKNGMIAAANTCFNTLRLKDWSLFLDTLELLKSKKAKILENLGG